MSMLEKNCTRISDRRDTRDLLYRPLYVSTESLQNWVGLSDLIHVNVMVNHPLAFRGSYLEPRGVMDLHESSRDSQTHFPQEVKLTGLLTSCVSQGFFFSFDLLRTIYALRDWFRFSDMHTCLNGVYVAYFVNTFFVLLVCFFFTVGSFHPFLKWPFVQASNIQEIVKLLRWLYICWCSVRFGIFLGCFFSL